VHHDVVVGVMKSLEAAFMVLSSPTEVQIWELTDEALTIIEKGR
jgi:hypothetical protein